MPTVQAARRAELRSTEGRLKRMIEIRAVEQAIQVLYSEGYIRGSTHLASGQEGVAVGIAAVAQQGDMVTCTYRGHGIALALGMAPMQVLGEVCGRAVGCAGGIGGSMHLCDSSIGLLPTFAIVGAGLPVSVGTALAAAREGAGAVSWAVCGDGATNIGAFHESLNMASVLKLPLVFVVENNLYGEYSPLRSTTPIDDLHERASGYAMRSAVVDGQDVDAVIETMSLARQSAAAGLGPTLVEVKTYRYSGHSRSDLATYRPAGELDFWLERDPIRILGERIWPTDAETALVDLRSTVDDEIRSIVDEMLTSEPQAEFGEMLLHVTG